MNSKSYKVERTLRQLGDDLGTWRKLRGMTQAQLADRAGIARNTLRNLERGEGGVSIANLLQVLRALGIVDNVSQALDPYESDVGRLRSEERLPERVRPRKVELGDG